MIFNRVSLLFDENKTIFFGLLVSLMLHALIFVFSGTQTFIPKAQFSVESSRQMIEVSIEPRQILVQSTRHLVSTHGTFILTKPLVQQRPLVKSQSTKASAGVVTKANPNYFQNPAPDYPPLAKQMHQEGLVLLSVDVSAQGHPVKAEIVQSSGYRILDQAALRAVAQWKFEPAHLGNIPIGSNVIVPIRFRLQPPMR